MAKNSSENLPIVGEVASNSIRLSISTIEGTVLGVATAEHEGDTYPHSLLASVHVDPSARRQGVGTRLVKALAATAVTNGKTTLVGTVTSQYGVTMLGHVFGEQAVSYRKDDGEHFVPIDAIGAYAHLGALPPDHDPGDDLFVEINLSSVNTAAFELPTPVPQLPR